MALDAAGYGHRERPITSRSAFRSSHRRIRVRSNWSSTSVSQFRIGADGTLSKIGTGSVATGSNPNAVTIDPFDRYAYVANLGENTISQYKIGIDGQLTPMAYAEGAMLVPILQTVVIDPTDHFAYAGNFGANAHDPPAGPSTISLYTVSQTDGSLTAMTGAAATAPTGSGPSAIADRSERQISLRGESRRQHRQSIHDQRGRHFDLR